MKEIRERFGFRKLTIGLASVCIGATLFGVDLNTVKADTIDSSSQATNAHKAEITNNTDTNDVTTISNSVNQTQSDKQNDATTLDSSNKTNASVNDANKVMLDTFASGKTGNVSKQVKANATNTLPSDSNNVHGATTATNTAPVNPAFKEHENKLTMTVDTNSVAKPATATPSSNITNKTLTASKVTTKNSSFDSKEDSNVISTANPRLLANLNKVLVAKQQQPALISKKIANVNLALIDNTLPVLNTNDAYALDEKNGLHEHANVNDNGGYDKDFWGTIDLNNWNYAQDDTGNITLEGYKGSDNTKIIVPNIADFAHGNAIKTITLQVNPNVDTDKVYISSNVMHDLAHNATRIGLSKTENKKVAASDTDWSNTFGGEANGPSGSNRDGGIKILNPNLSIMDLHNLDTSNITDMSAMFNGGTNLETIGDLSDWDTSKVTNMKNMFRSASSLTNIGDLDNWKTGNVTDMSFMFDKVSNLTNIGDLSNWDTSKVTTMKTMFQLASSLTNIGNLDNWNTGNVTDMGWMFFGASSLTNIGNLSKWNTGNVTNTSSMFVKTSNLTNIGNLSKWDTGNVTDMSRMFAEARKLTNIGNLSDWDTGNVTDMCYMFYRASDLTNIGDLSKWDTGNVTDMSFMFSQASSLTNIGNLDNWDTGNVTDMSHIFYDASSLTNMGDLSKWKTGNVTDMSYMFNDASNLTNIGNLSKWDTDNVTDMSFMFSQASSLTNIGDLSNWNTGNVTDMSLMFSRASSLTNIGDLSNWNTGNVTDMSYMFSDTSNLTNIGNLDNWDTGNVTDMSHIFYDASSLTNIGDLSKWKTGNVTDMSYMFTDALNLTNIGDLSKWDTSNVTDMEAMFYLASNLTNIGNLDNWNTGNVTNMSYMFYDALNLTNIGDLSKWKTGNVTDMSYMFTEAFSLTNIGDLSKWNTSNVTDMSYMFTEAFSLTNIGDLSKWNTSNVTDMSNMFKSTKSLHNLNISNWNLTKVIDKNRLHSIFEDDTNLTVIANDITLPAWYDDELNNAGYFWNNHMAVITNNDKLLKSTGATDTLTIDNTQSARSIFYDSKGSSDAVKVLTDANDQYMTDYHKSNPTKFLKLAETVNKNDPIALANASFVTVPDSDIFHITVHFEDVDPNADEDNATVKQELAKTVDLLGDKGNAADLSQMQLPTNFELSGGLPSAIFGDTDSVTIHLKHEMAYIDPLDGKTYNYSNMTDEEKQMAFKQLTYHLIVNGPDGEHDFGPTGFTLTHMLERDLVTGKSKLYDGKDGVLKTGTYMRPGWWAVLGDFKDDTAEDVLESANKFFNDPSTKLDTSMDMFRFEHNMMDHYGDDTYRISAFDPFMDVMTTTSLFAIGHDAATLHSYYVHEMNPDMDDEYNAMMPEVMINSIVPQNYHIEVPSFIKQESYDWSGNKGTYYTLTNNDGFGLALQVGDDNSVLAHLYASNYQDPTETVLDFPENYTIRLNVVPNEQKSSYYFVDDDNSGAQVGDPVEIKGKTDETVTINPVLPNNYEVVGKLPTSYTFTNTKDPNKAVTEQGAYSVYTSPLVIHLKHKMQVTTESLPATRTITLHLPNNETQTIVQTINYARNKHHDLVTDKDTYDNYAFDASKSFTTINDVKSDVATYKLKDGQVYFAAYKLPKIAGYKATIRKDKDALTETKLPNGMRRFNFMQLFSVDFVAMPANSTDHGAKQINASKPAVPTGNDTVQNNKVGEDHGNKVNDQDQTNTGKLSYNDQDQINTTNQTGVMTNGYTNALNITNQNHDAFNGVIKDNHASVNKSDIKKTHLVNDVKKKDVQLPSKVAGHTNTSFNTGTSHIVSAATFGKTKTNQLPQTGANQDTNIKIGIFGLLATLFGLIGFNIDPKKYKKD